MEYLDITPRIFKASDLLTWWRERSLDLSPFFQRRPVWRPGEKSYFIDTVARGLPVPLLMMRERLDLSDQKTHREVVDGQQRLRTLFTYIDPASIPDLSPERDDFTIRRTHNPELARYGGFKGLPDELKERILSYEFSILMLPRATEDRDVFEIFARLNATGTKLNGQELRNAQYHGEFKTLMYELALEQLDRWREWGVMTENELARMEEAELVSDLVLNMMKGVSGKSKAALDRLYKDNDQAFGAAEVVAARYRRTLDVMDDEFGPELESSVFRNKIHFVSLFSLFYDEMYGLGSALAETRPHRIPRGLRACLMKASDQISREAVPPDMLKAFQGASSDRGRRQTRLNFLQTVCDVGND